MVYASDSLALAGLETMAHADRGRFGRSYLAYLLVPTERNFLLNPAHPDFPNVEIDEPLEFSFDTRLAQSP